MGALLLKIDVKKNKLIESIVLDRENIDELLSMNQKVATKFQKALKKAILKKYPLEYRSYKNINGLDNSEIGKSINSIFAELSMHGLIAKVYKILDELVKTTEIPFNIQIIKSQQENNLQILLTTKDVSNKEIDDYCKRIESYERKLELIKAQLRNIIDGENSCFTNSSFEYSLTNNKFFLRYTIINSSKYQAIKLVRILNGKPYFVDVSYASTGVFIDGENIIFNTDQKLSVGEIFYITIKGTVSEDIPTRYTFTPLLEYMCDDRKRFDSMGIVVIRNNPESN